MIALILSQLLSVHVYLLSVQYIYYMYFILFQFIN